MLYCVYIAQATLFLCKMRLFSFIGQKIDIYFYSCIAEIQMVLFTLLW